MGTATEAFYKEWREKPSLCVNGRELFVILPRRTLADVDPFAPALLLHPVKDAEDPLLVER